MTPQANDPLMTPERLELLGALHALHYLLNQVERKAANKIFRSGKNQKASIDCIMDALQVFIAAIDKCETGPGQGGNGGGGGQGPNCRPGFHEEFGICVPNNA